MAAEDDAGLARARSRAAAWMAATAAAVLAAVAVGVWWILAFADEQLARETTTWRERLSIVAEARARAVEDWTGRQLDEVGALAESDTIRLLVTELAQVGYDATRVEDVQPQKGYVANLLTATASRAGFEGPVLGPDIDANVDRRGTAGLGLLRPDGRPIVTTADMPPVELPEDAGEATGPRLAGIGRDSGGALAMTVYAPVFGVQRNAEPGTAVAYVVGTKRVGGELFPLLQQPGATAETLASTLLARRAAAVVNLAPLPDGTAPLDYSVPQDAPEAAAAFAVRRHGGFAARTGAGGRTLLTTSRRIEPTGWTLMTTVDRAEALGAAERRIRRLAIGMGLALLVAGVALLAVWRHGASRRAFVAGERYRRTAEKLDAQYALLRRVTDSQPTAIAICDGDDRIRFANRRVGEATGADADDLIGKSLAAAFGPAVAAETAARNREALQDGRTVSRTLERDGRVLIAHHVPLPPGGDLPASVLLVEHDVTGEVRERERRERILGQLVETIVSIVDGRDPRAADKSRRVGRLAAEIAGEIGLPAGEREAARFAGTLANLGKALVPAELLTRAGRLSADELELIRAQTRATADLLAGVEFEGPVVESLRQIYERVDGQGHPAGLAGEEIRMPARVVAVANAFVGLVSARADRAAYSADDALAVLWSEAGAAYDRGAVAALVSVVQHRGGGRPWEGPPA